MTVEEVDERVQSIVLGAVAGRSLEDVEVVQSLWGGYGQILRCVVAGGTEPRVIVKHVRFPSVRDHPYGWTSDASHERKVESYRVEAAWYETYAESSSDHARAPRCFAIDTGGAGAPSASAVSDGVVMVLEDLDGAGFADRLEPHELDLVDLTEIDAGLSWLANFHAAHMGQRPAGLWPTGTYWHLATRQDELAVMADGPLKEAASAIDGKLERSAFHTFVHGDAKLANFCFSSEGTSVAAVDFQYVGGGCGIKDVAYFISSCLDDEESEALVPDILDRYFAHLRAGLARVGSTVDADLVEADWRALYPVAWTDFTRFLKGWSPGHWKLHGYSDRLAAEVLATLDLER